MIGINRTVLQVQAGLERAGRAASQEAAGLSVPPGMTMDEATGMLGTTSAIRNTEAGRSMLSTADAALGEVADLALQIRTLAVQAATGTLSDGDRSALQTTVHGLGAQMASVLATRYNGIPLFSGSTQAGIPESFGYVFQTGSQTGDQISVSLPDLALPPGGDSSGPFMVDAGNGGDGPANARETIDAIDAYMGVLNQARASIGAGENGLARAGELMTNTAVSIGSQLDAIDGLSWAASTTRLAKDQLLADSSTALLAQANANRQQVLALLSPPV
jgi:flagellin